MTRDELARRCLVKLVARVLAHQSRTLTGITYEDLAREIGFFNKHGEPQSRLGQALATMGHLLEGVDLGWEERIPLIQALVVVKRGRNRGIPDDGIKEFWKGYELLSRVEKQHKAQAEWEEIADFGSRWNTVLARLNLVPVHAPVVTSRFGSGGESPAHKALKEYIEHNPHLVGVGAGANAFPEYALPSLDKIDVLFKAPGCWTAVEVKSSVSDRVADDYERGVYQIVKYTAILQAMQRDPKYSMPETIKLILVLETTLPPVLAALAASLQVNVLDRVTASTQPTP